MPPPPAPTPWTGLSLTLVLSGALGLPLALAGAAWVTLGQQTAATSTTAPSDAPTVAFESQESRAAPALLPVRDDDANLSTRPTASGPREMLDLQSLATAEPDNVGGILQHLATNDTAVSEITVESPPAADATDTAVGETPAATQTVRQGLSRKRLADTPDTSAGTGGDSQAATAGESTEAAAADAPAPAYEELFEVQNEEDLSAPTAEHRYQEDVQRFISFYNIAWSTNSPPHRNIGWNVATRGWPTFVRFHIEPQIEQGVRRFQLHNPFGALADEAMQLDQLLHAEEAGLLQVTTRFAEAWKPITDQGIEVIAYVGCGRDDEDFRDLPIDQWLERAFRSVQPCLDANMSIALDAAVVAAEGSPTHIFAQQLRARGVRVYVEAKPTRTTPHWFDFDVMALDQTWLNSDIENGHPQARDRYGISNDKLTGEVVRMVRPRNGETNEDLNKFPVMHDRIRDILDDGNSVSLGAYYWFKQGRTLRDLLYIDDRQAGYD